MQKVYEGMGLQESILALSDGNPGAIRVTVELYKMDDQVLFDLDRKKLYGSDIWGEFKNVHKKNYDSFLKALKS